jgi:multidrug efflux pump subunit AcrB
MAVTLMFGLAVSTFLTMVVVPVVYSMIENAFAKRKKDKSLVITG